MLFIKNAKIYTMMDKIYENGCVLIEDGKIKEVGENLQAPSNAEIINAEGKLLMPGFIEAHCHLGLWEDAIGFEGADGNESVDPITPQLRAIDAINPMDRTFEEARKGGVTTVCTGPGSANVIGGTFTTIKTWGNRVDNMVVKEPAALKIAFGENPKRTYNAKGKSPITRMATAALLREQLYKAKAYKEKLEKSQNEGEKAPDFDFKLETLVKVLKKEIPLKAHAHRTDDIFTALRIAKEFDVDITLDHCTEGHLIVEELLKEGKYIISGPQLTDRSKFELKNKTFKSPAIMSNAGIKLAITTDHPVVPIQYLPICAGLAAKEGMDEMEALKAITIYPAEVLGLKDRLGSIEAGKDADIVIFEGHPFDTQAKTWLVIIDGKIVYNLEQ